jgi:enediyne biosynthesis protein E7
VLAGRPPRHEDLANLRYTRMVIEESMRLYPPAHTLAHQSIASDELLGHRIPAGATVLIVPWLLHRKPSLWERPDRFGNMALVPAPRAYDN